ncbi:MAG TPA: RNA polymerase sigma factor [Acidimicrobiales bacterium]|nr:RNA polymerase sigma factor [Acidimicrobiales bacterium]
MVSGTAQAARSRQDDVDLERDRALVERCQAGDQRAFEDLYLRYRERLLRACLRRTGNATEAEDVVQEAFARAWKALPDFAGERRFYPWLSVIANNLCTDAARRNGRCTPVAEPDLDLVAPAQAPEQERLVESAGDGQMLAAALDRLSPRHREVLELREQRNWSYQQIAAHSGVEVSTIETLLFRARRSLRREFLTLTRAESGLAGLVALPLVVMRRLWRGARRALAHLAKGARPGTAAMSSAPAVAVAGTAVAVAMAVAITLGLASGPSLVPTSSVRSTHGALASAPARPAVAVTAGGLLPGRLAAREALPGAPESARHETGASNATGNRAVGSSGLGAVVSAGLGGLSGAMSGATKLLGTIATRTGAMLGTAVASATTTVDKTAQKTVKSVKKTVKHILGGGGGLPGLSGLSGVGGLP